MPILAHLPTNKPPGCVWVKTIFFFKYPLNEFSLLPPIHRSSVPLARIFTDDGCIYTPCEVRVQGCFGLSAVHRRRILKA